MERLVGEMSNATRILFANAFTLTTVVDVEADDSRRDTDEDEPVARRQARALFKP